MEILAPLALLGIGWLTCWAWQKSRPADAALFLQGYHAGWADRTAALRRACGEETTGCYSLAETIRQANERMQ